MAEACGTAFADSYLSGAVELDGALVPRTRIAWERLKMKGAAMEVLRRQGLKLLEPVLRGAQKERTDLTEEEYSYLSVTEKLRHHLMCANEAWGRAGPMWKKSAGGPVGPDQLSEKWHKNTEIAKNHMAEAKHLRRLIYGDK